VFEGLEYAWRLEFCKVELNVDSLRVVEVIKYGGISSAMGYSLTKEIHRLVSLEWDVKILHSYREANQCADRFANMKC
jgi:ribonuclease HI